MAEMVIKENVDSMNLREQFEVFKKAYEKKYSSLQEEQRRFEIFKENLAVIENLMAERKGNVVFGIGPYTDLTSDEYLTLMGISETEDTSSETSNLERRMLESRGSSNNWNWWRSRSVPPRGPEPSLPPPPPSRTTSVPSFCKYASDFFVGKYSEGGPMLDWRVPVQYYPETEPQNLPGRECKACWAFAAADAIAIELARSRCKIVPLSKQASHPSQSRAIGAARMRSYEQSSIAPLRVVTQKTSPYPPVTTVHPPSRGLRLRADLTKGPVREILRTLTAVSSLGVAIIAGDATPRQWKHF
ncbi:unnamed protein product [Bemisia tabaci]|uniref:Cathepsin propeptide inhibitor domain-containing protein n=1 Tax=Bemisia tabaci TaxID=7038 RepID=A0A9P0AMI4_BEMTA|nr:unnamed protein product [Bemisia tabaci]